MPPFYITQKSYFHVLQKISHPKGKRVADSKICHAFRAFMASFHLWCATLFEPESAKSYLSNVEFLPFLHKFNTFTFYTPYLLFLDQLQNEGKRGFSIRFQNQYIRGVYCQYPIFICFSTNFKPKGKRHVFGYYIANTRFFLFFDQLETHRIELIFLYFC